MNYKLLLNTINMKCEIVFRENGDTFKNGAKEKNNSSFIIHNL